MPNSKKKRLNPAGVQKSNQNAVKRLEKHKRNQPNDKQPGVSAKLAKAKDCKYFKNSYRKQPLK